MYIGEILVGVGILATISFVLLIAYLLYSRKRNRLYQEILIQETRAFEAFDSTIQIMREATSASIHVQSDYSTASATAKTALDGFDGTEGTMLEESFTDGTAHTVLDLDLPLENQSEGVQTEATSASNFTSSTTSSGIYTTGLGKRKPEGGLDWSPLEGQYEFIEEIKGGGMSRVFKALKINTGNEWIVKFIPKSIGELTQEADILKDLNHVNLPSIIDIFQGKEGQFLVESFIQGVGMDQVLKSHEAIPVFKVLDWAEELAQVLSYLHNMKEPFLHLDLKPSNIMVTHDDKLVLIDFGISRRQSEVSGAVGATLSYAAPEQLKRKVSGKGLEIIEKRFGELPPERKDWRLDVRTDIYSLGVILFEAAVGYIPQHKHMGVLKNYLPVGLCDIIYKCLKVDPAERYQSVDDLLADIQKQKNAKSRMHFSLLTRKTARFAAVAAVGIAVFGFTMGTRLIEIEARTIMTIDPAILTVSVLQSSEIRLTRLLSDTYEERPLNENNLRWELSANNVAQVDGSRVVGLNIGETLIHGQYRHNEVTIQVQVVEPMDGIVEISQRYPTGNEVFLFAGTTHRERIDGNLASVEFVGPESMDVADNGAIYLTDAGILRRIYNGTSETIRINPPHLMPRMVRTYGNDVFILTDAWYEDGGFFYGLLRLSSDGTSGMEGFFLGDAQHTDIRDFTVENGLIYLVEWNAGEGITYLRTINVNNAGDIRTLTAIPDGISALAIGNDTVFLADSEQGALLAYDKRQGNINRLAGAAGERAFIDGAAPLFYQPSRLRYLDNVLYVWDFNVLRKIRLEDGMALEAISLAGAVSPVYNLEFSYNRERAERIVLPHSRLMDFVILPQSFNSGQGGILLTDPKRGVIWGLS